MQPLEGVTVLDLARGYPGAYTTMFLGDFGADVIRVDPPPRAEQPPEPAIKEAAYNTVNRNKRSIVINLQTAAGQEVFRRLVKTADVLLEGFRPGVMKRLGADYEALKSTNPRLVYCSLSGFGQTGPYAHLPGHDMNYISIAGLLSQIGPKGGAPCLPSNYLADMAGAGLHGVVGILLALSAREKTGRGQYVDISYLDGAMSLLAYDAPRYFATGVVPKRGESNFTGGLPWVNVYRCKDGEYITVATLEGHLYENLCRALGREDLIGGQREPPEQHEATKAAFAEAFLQRTRNEWWDFFKDKDTCVGPVYYLDEALRDPQVQHRGMVVEVAHPSLGPVKQLGIPIKLSETPGKIKSLGRVSGADSRSVLVGLGYSEEQIKALGDQGVVGLGGGALPSP
jgi:crotonobetainyl-CoA:carnitine CoA-transferase CaiB-like acyl-CoA transferase